MSHPRYRLRHALIAAPLLAAHVAGLPIPADCRPASSHRPSTRAARQADALDSYLQDVRQYRLAGPVAIPDSFQRRDPDRLSALAEGFCSAAMRGDERVSPAVIQGAVLLHMAAAMEPHSDRASRERQFLLAASIVDCARPRISRSFQHGFAIASVWFWQGRSALLFAAEALDDAQARFGVDGDLLLAKATLWETIAVRKNDERRNLLKVPAVAPIVMGSRETGWAWESTRKIYQECASALSKAIDLVPDLGEARVRLAHVQLALDRPAEAASAVAPLLGPSVTRTAVEQNPVPYLAALMHGRAMLATTSVYDALSSMRLAQSMCPNCQTARVAVSQALRASGDSRAADEMLLAVLRDGRSPLATWDPWWDYPAGQFWRLPELMAALFEATWR